MIKEYRVAIVTGASHGIGPFIARELAKQKLQLVLAARSASELEALAAELRATGATAVAVPTDVTDAASREALIAAAERELGPVDLLVNNAGGDPLRAFHHYSAGDVEAVMSLNLTAPIELTRLLLPGMLERKRGHIVNISAIGGHIGFPLTEVYSASKDGLIAFTRVLRADYRSAGVSASTLVLGSIGGAGTGQRNMEQLQAAGLRMPAMSAALNSTPEAVARAVVKALRRDRAEIVVMPGPGRLLKALMDFFPGMGPAMNRMAGATKLMGKLAEIHEAQRAA